MRGLKKPPRSRREPRRFQGAAPSISKRRREPPGCRARTSFKTKKRENSRWIRLPITNRSNIIPIPCAKRSNRTRQTTLTPLSNRRASAPSRTPRSFPSTTPPAPRRRTPKKSSTRARCCAVLPSFSPWRRFWPQCCFWSSFLRGKTTGPSPCTAGCARCWAWCCWCSF